MADFASDVAADRTADLSVTDKIGEAMRRSLPLLPGEAQGVVLDMLKPENLAVIGATVVVWAASQFFGVGEFVDFILLVYGVRTLGFSVLTGARELYYFVTTAVNATTSQDLDVAGQHFAQAVTILGVAVVQAVLMKGAADNVSARGRPPITLRIPDTDPPPTGSRPPGTSDLPPDAPDSAEIGAAADSTASVNLADRAAQIRANLNVGAGRNIAVAQYTIDGATDELIAVSGQASRPGTVDAPAEQIFDTIPTGNNPRTLDAEYKILSNLALKLKPSSQGIVNLYSELPVCVSCNNVINQFQQRFPGVFVNVTTGKP